MGAGRVFLPHSPSHLAISQMLSRDDSPIFICTSGTVFNEISRLGWGAGKPKDPGNEAVNALLPNSPKSLASPEGLLLLLPFLLATV